MSMQNKNRIPMIGRHFGRLMVLEEDQSPGTSTKNLRWLCVCDCGNRSSVYGRSLRKGHVKSCGCFRRENAGQATLTHGMTKSREFQTWGRIIQRCTNPKSDAFSKYGGKGIRVCERWLSSFENFYADMGPRPPGKSIDRIDPAGDYEPGNCRWATPLEQTLNRGVTINFSINGRTQCLEHWCREYGTKSETVQQKLALGWPIERALTEKVPRGFWKDQRDRIEEKIIEEMQ